MLVSCLGGFATMEDLERDMAILANSGRDWADRTKRLGVRLPISTSSHPAWSSASFGGWRSQPRNGQCSPMRRIRSRVRKRILLLAPAYYPESGWRRGLGVLHTPGAVPINDVAAEASSIAPSTSRPLRLKPVCRIPELHLGSMGSDPLRPKPSGCRDAGIAPR
jgi:hypothetical protein